MKSWIDDIKKSPTAQPQGQRAVEVLETKAGRSLQKRSAKVNLNITTLWDLCRIQAASSTPVFDETRAATDEVKLAFRD